MHTIMVGLFFGKMRRLTQMLPWLPIQENIRAVDNWGWDSTCSVAVLASKCLNLDGHPGFTLLSLKSDPLHHGNKEQGCEPWEGIYLLRWTPRGQRRAQILWIIGVYGYLLAEGSSCTLYTWKNLILSSCLPAIDRVNYYSEAGFTFLPTDWDCPIPPKWHKNRILICIYANQSELLHMTNQNRTM